MVGIVLVAHKLRMLRGDTDLLAAGDGDLLSGGRRASRLDVPERGGGNGPRDVSKVCSYGGGDHSPCPLLLGAERSARHQRDLPRRKRSRTKSGEGIPEFRGTLPLNSGKPPTVGASREWLDRCAYWDLSAISVVRKLCFTPKTQSLHTFLHS